MRKGDEVGMIMIDIDMPDNCDECRFSTEYAFCKAMPDNFCGNTDDRKRPEWCPLKEQEELLKHEYWRGYNNGRADERGLQEGTIMQTFDPD